MDAEELLSAEVVAALERGATIVTGNQRAARTLRMEFDKRNRALGRKSWQPARVVAWDGWLVAWWSRLLLEGQTLSTLLNRSQELAVWRGVLEQDRERQSLRGVDPLAQMASEAWNLLGRYNAFGSLRGLTGSTDTRTFQRWAKAFERRCRSEGFLTQAALAETLRNGIATKDFRVNEVEIFLLGFDRLLPDQSRIVEALQDAGVGVELRLADSLATKRLLVQAADEDEELRACARWIRKTLEAQPEARVGVIVPKLETERAGIDRVFREVLAPELEEISAGGGPFEFSVGTPLALAPMVLVALDLLRWMQAPLPLERVSSLLLSPYFAAGRSDLIARAEFDAFSLRRTKMLRPEISLETMVDLIRDAGPLRAVAGALRTLQKVAARWLAKDENLTHSEWAEAMREALEAAAWGADRAEDSLEFQTRAKWENALDELATLDFDDERIRFGTALGELERIAQRTVFAAQSRETPVQIMGPLEAAGTRFDAVWFLRAGEMSWPMATSTTPLLPWALQRELGMPGADSAHETEFTRQMSRRIAASARTAVFSYASVAGKENGKQRASAALEGLGLEKLAIADIFAGGPARQIVATEKSEDTSSLPALPDKVIRGGAALLAAQAACGFKAFAEQRIWSSEPDVADLGMDAAQRGTLVHRVLESFWKNVKTQEELKAMPVSEREEMLDWCIGQELRGLETASVTAWDVAYINMERRRLHNLLGAWLELELKRPPFEVKLSEKRFDDVRVGPLRLQVIVDRVDLVDDGGSEEGEDATESAEMIVDYKTGRAEPGQWMTSRPDAPQLPLYAILSNAPRIAGVAFAKVRLGEEMHLNGYATQAELVTKGARLKDVANLEAQIEEWRRVLTQLAEEFAAGDARVRPKHYPSTCEHCLQRLVCRLDVALLEIDVEEESGDSDE